MIGYYPVQNCWYMACNYALRLWNKFCQGEYVDSEIVKLADSATYLKLHCLIRAFGSSLRAVSLLLQDAITQTRVRVISMRRDQGEDPRLLGTAGVVTVTRQVLDSMPLSAAVGSRSPVRNTQVALSSLLVVAML